MNKSNFICEVKIVHADAVEKAANSDLKVDTAEKLELFFKVFADSTRLRILSALLVTELCVCDICAALKLKQSTVSQQLRLLRQMRLVKARQEGKSVYYSLDDEHIHEILQMGLNHINEVK